TLQSYYRCDNGSVNNVDTYTTMFLEIHRVHTDFPTLQSYKMKIVKVVLMWFAAVERQSLKVCKAISEYFHFSLLCRRFNRITQQSKLSHNLPPNLYILLFCYKSP
ncbi:hypothetical protein L9F63_027806, partial [Diploptera punctata]